MSIKKGTKRLISILLFLWLAFWIITAFYSGISGFTWIAIMIGVVPVVAIKWVDCGFLK